jgi:hypothetical protein
MIDVAVSVAAPSASGPKGVMHLWAAAVIGALVLLPGCDNSPTGAGCRYARIAGTATVVSVRPAPSGWNNCRDAAEVIFDFHPADPGAPAHYRYPDWPDSAQQLTVGDGKNPPGGWVEAQALSVGSVHPCRRMESTAGICTPVIFVFEDVDYGSYVPGCY